MADERGHAIDTLAPQLLVSVEQTAHDAEPVQIGADHLAVADPVLADQACTLEHCDVFLDRREAHRVVAGELGDTFPPINRAPDDVTTGDVRKRAKDAVKVGRDGGHDYNHTVVYSRRSSVYTAVEEAPEMGNVVIEMSMSLDGYIAGPNDNPEQGLGEDGMRLHNWAFDDPAVLERFFGDAAEGTGAVIMGRRSYDNSIREWGGKGPLGEVPCFVLTHRTLEGADPIFTAVTDGIEDGLARARQAAGDKHIGLMGANVDQQFLAAGLVDEIRIHLINVLFGDGRRLFDRLPQRIELEQTEVGETDGVAHLTYRVIR
jgi:dihydrofolate reductase